MCTKKRTPTLSVDKNTKNYTAAYQLLHQFLPLETFTIRNSFAFPPYHVCHGNKNRSAPAVKSISIKANTLCPLSTDTSLRRKSGYKHRHNLLGIGFERVFAAAQAPVVHEGAFGEGVELDHFGG